MMHRMQQDRVVFALTFIYDLPARQPVRQAYTEGGTQYTWDDESHG